MNGFSRYRALSAFEFKVVHPNRGTNLIIDKKIFFANFSWSYFAGRCKKNIWAKMIFGNSVFLHFYIFWFTGKSLSEALILVSTNPQYDKRLLIELQVQFMKIASLEHSQNMLWLEFWFWLIWLMFIYFLKFLIKLKIHSEIKKPLHINFTWNSRSGLPEIYSQLWLGYWFWQIW